MQPNDISTQIEANDLFQIVDYYVLTTRRNWIGYEYQFNTKGKIYIVDLFRQHPDFACWFACLYPNMFETLSNEYQIASEWSVELSDSINILLGYRAA